MQAGGQKDAHADGGVRHDRDPAGLGQGGDAQELGRAGMPHLRLDDRRTAAFEAQLRIVDGTPLFAQGDRRPHGARHLRLRRHLLRGHRRFREPGVVRLQAADHPDRLRRLITPVQVDADPHRRPELPAQRGELGHRSPVGHGAGELHGVEPAGAPPARDGRALGQGGCRKARDVGGDRRPPPAAEQIRERAPAEPAGQVPERDVDGGQRVEVEAAGVSPDAHQGVQVIVDGGRVERVAPDDEFAEQIVDDRRRGSGRHQTVGLAPPLGACG